MIVIVVVRNQPPGQASAAQQLSLRQAGADVRDSFLTPGTRLGLWTHFSAQFSGFVFALLWGYPFLTIGLGYSPGLAGGLITMMIFASGVVGPVLGQKILDWRSAHGAFTSVDELLEVDGIGDKTLADIAPHVTL